jgi:hypothetical protein
VREEDGTCQLGPIGALQQLALIVEHPDVGLQPVGLQGLAGIHPHADLVHQLLVSLDGRPEVLVDLVLLQPIEIGSDDPLNDSVAGLGQFP